MTKFKTTVLRWGWVILILIPSCVASRALCNLPFSHTPTHSQFPHDHCCSLSPFKAWCSPAEYQDSYQPVLLARSFYLPSSEKFGIRVFGWGIGATMGRTLSLGSLARPKTFRLINCGLFRQGVLLIVEWPSLDFSKDISYHAISYVWRGTHKPPVSDSFAVEGATDADRIDFKVLGLACARNEFIWFDQLCIAQKNPEDKNWHIQHMQTIYRNSQAGLVFTDGMGGLPTPQIEDDWPRWLYRSWTLQESLLPPYIYTIVPEPDSSGALVWKQMLLSSNPKQKTRCSSNRNSAATHSMPLSTEGIHHTKLALYDGFAQFILALLLRNFMDISECKGPMGVSLDDLNSEMFQAMVWRSAMMRSATKGVDSVFSIMGLFSVQLDPTKYDTQSEALFALLQNILKNGGTVNWLAASVITPGLLPILPVPSVEGVPSVQTPKGLVEARVLIEGLDWFLIDAPKGVLDDTGALTIMAPLSPALVVSVVSQSRFRGFHYHGMIGDRAVYFSGRPGTHAVLLGRISNPGNGEPYKSQEQIAVLLEPLGDKWGKVGMAQVPYGLTRGWKVRPVVIVGHEDGNLYE